MRQLTKAFPTAMGLILALMAGGVLLSAVSCSDQAQNRDDDATQVVSTIHANERGYIGATACAQCHQQEHADWVGSHHEQAMKPANEQTVLGDFDDAVFEHFGVVSRFFKKDGKFFINTDGPDGKNADFEIKYTFGVEPLQQYLIEFPGGRVQALTVCWDARPEPQGGQRWYHLYADEPIPAGDALHWTGPNFTWNHMCAECHSTDLHKNFDIETGTYDTTWNEINVSCEACHGPGEDHATWAKQYAAGPSIDKGDMGLTVRLKDETRRWVMNLETGIAERATPLEEDHVLNACARCHSRRGQIAEGSDAGELPGAGVSFHDNYRGAHLTEGLYFADGQIQDEVYVWGSFTQSKMHMAGVSCVDCHDPHTAQVRSQTNSLCATCHQPSKFDTPEHHFHEVGSTGASCVNCHMPHRTYMGVDDRRDHSFRIPRPDLSVALGTPNACNQCHDDKSPAWAAAQSAQWWGTNADRPVHYGQIFHAARENHAGTDLWLLTILRDKEQPGIVRGTAVVYLSRYQTSAAARGVIEALSDDEPMVRLAAVDALSNMPLQTRFGPAMAALDDPLRSIRIEAGEALADIPPDVLPTLTEADRTKIAQGIAAYREAQNVMADTANATMNLGTLAYRLGDVKEAAKQFDRAIQIDPSFYPAYINRANIAADTNRLSDAVQLLDEGLSKLPNQPDLLHAKALLLIRQRDYPQGVALLSQAYQQAPERADIAYIYAVALHDTGQPVQAIGVLQKSLETTPNDAQVLILLAQYSLEMKDEGAALNYAQEAQKLLPEDMGIQAFVEQLKALQP